MEPSGEVGVVDPKLVGGVGRRRVCFSGYFFDSTKWQIGLTNRQDLQEQVHKKCNVEGDQEKCRDTELVTAA